MIDTWTNHDGRPMNSSQWFLQDFATYIWRQYAYVTTSMENPFGKLCGDLPKQWA
jgi:hypothetical protein